MTTKRAALAEQAQLAAERDWTNKVGQVLTSAEVYSNAPLIDRCGLYLRMSAEKRGYVDAYNRRMRELLAEYGLPDWSPGRRLPSVNELMPILSKATPFAEMVAFSKEEERLVHRHARLWRYDAPGGPEVFLRIQDRQVVVLAGTVDRVLRIDVLDLHAAHWMTRYEIERDTQRL